MKNVLIYMIVFVVFSCKAQQTFPLNTDYLDIPDYSYLKDINNELDPYVGTYKANYQGNEITLYITKVQNKLEEAINKTYYMDALVVKYIVKNSSGMIIKDTKNLNSINDKFYSIGTKPIINSVIFAYSGTNCNVGWGRIMMKKPNFNQISWSYRPGSSVLTEVNCPGNPDFTVYLPDTDHLNFYQTIATKARQFVELLYFCRIITMDPCKKNFSNTKLKQRLSHLLSK